MKLRLRNGVHASTMADSDKRHRSAPPDVCGLFVSPVEDSVIVEACRRLGLTLVKRQDVHSIRSAHAVVLLADGSHAWLKVNGLRDHAPFDGRSRSENEAEALCGLPKPKLIEDIVWQEDNVMWRAAITTLAPSPAASRRPWTPPSQSEISDSWFVALRDALASLRNVSTTRRLMTPEAVRNTIVTHFGEDAPTEVSNWHVSHGDLHWANVTAPNLALLDWENWGFAPQGYAAARLLTFTLLDTAMAERVKMVFADELSAPCAQVALLLAIARTKNDVRSGVIPNSLFKPLDDLAASVLSRV